MYHYKKSVGTANHFSCCDANTGLVRRALFLVHVLQTMMWIFTPSIYILYIEGEQIITKTKQK